MLVRHFMTRDVVTLDAALSCQQALHVLRGRRIRRAPVLEGSELAGIVTERDLVISLPWRVDLVDSELGRAAAARPVREIMSKPVLTVGPNEHLDAIARLMMERHIGTLPVVERGAIVGILTESDLFRIFARLTMVGDGLRLTLEKPERARPRIEALAAAQGLALDVQSYFKHLAFGGRELIVLRVAGARAGELAPMLVDAGWILVDLEGQHRRASA